MTRELISSQLDGEFLSPAEAHGAESHLQGCRECNAWRLTASLAHRTLRVAASAPVPDLTSGILRRLSEEAAAEPPPRPHSLPTLAARLAPAARVALGVIAASMMVGAISQHLTSGMVPGHLPLDTLGFHLALASGLLAAACRPKWAAGVAVSAFIAALILVLTAVGGISSGETTGSAEINHMLEVAGALLACVIARAESEVRPSINQRVARSYP